MANKFLDRISFSVQEGEICSVLGENGAGKSILVKLIGGAEKPDSGQIFFDGNPVSYGSVKDAQSMGIHVIFQDSQLIEDLSVSQNIFLTNPILRGKSFLLNKKAQRQKAVQILTSFNCSIDPDEKIRNLSFADRKIVEIAKAFCSHARLLILDEVTEFFTSHDFNRLKKLLHQLQDEHVGIIFISHRPEEILTISDHLIIIDDGKIAEDTVHTDSITPDILIRKVAGKDYSNRYPKIFPPVGDTLLSLEHICPENHFPDDITMQIKRGEIIGIAGLRGSGKTTLCRILAGDLDFHSGKYLYFGQEMHFKDNLDAIKKGIGYMTDDIGKNIFPSMDPIFNVSLILQRKTHPLRLISVRTSQKQAKRHIASMGIKKEDRKKEARNLSRGTQQKLILSRWLNTDFQILVMDEPSATLDAASKVELYNLMGKFVSSGKSIVIASSDHQELAGMCDRVYVLAGSTVAAELDLKKLSRRGTCASDILRHAMKNPET